MITEEGLLEQIANAGEIKKEDAAKLFELAKSETFKKFLASVLKESELIALRLSKADLTVEAGIKHALREQGISAGMENIVHHLLGIFTEHGLIDNEQSEGNDNDRSSNSDDQQHTGQLAE